MICSIGHYVEIAITFEGVNLAITVHNLKVSPKDLLARFVLLSKGDSLIVDHTVGD